jgi:cytochrome c biogenesis protein CcmG/thiol:disulfide interchange protein DsbE
VKRVVTALAALALCTTAAAAAADRPALAGHDVVTGKPLSLAGYRGKAVFVNFWGSWCGGCTVEAPTLVEFARAHAGDVVFLGVNTLDSKAGARAFVRKYGMTWRSIWDPRGLLAGAWTRGAPTTLVFDRKHHLVQRIEGSATPKELRAALRRATRP